MVDAQQAYFNKKKEKKKAIKIKLITDGGSTYGELNQVSNLSYLKTFH